MATHLSKPEKADPLDAWGLPAWTYRDPEFYQLELERVFRPSWQLVCHSSDIARPGDWQQIKFCGESVIVVRGRDAKPRAFTNVCRHRGSRILDGESGCAKRLTCPYHGWTYGLDGALIGVCDEASYPALDKPKFSLSSIELQEWRGFLFVRLDDDGGPSVAQMMAPYDAMIEPYRFEELSALGRVTMRPRQVNWKNVGDNYSDGLHIPVAHPGLSRLFGKSYGVEAEEYVDRMWGEMVRTQCAGWSERLYQKLLPRAAHLAEENQRQWLYFKLWPNTAFDIYPDQIDFMQWLPTGPTSCLIREISYAVSEPPDYPWRREMRAARYLNWRINRRVNAEDTQLITRVQEGMESRSFSAGPLSDKEVCLKSFCARMRRIIPEARLAEPPQPGWSRI